MTQVFMEDTESLKWMQEVHKINALEYRCAILYGNEDSPSKIELYAKNHYQCKPTVYEPNANGVLVLKQMGQHPGPKFLVDRPATEADARRS